MSRIRRASVLLGLLGLFATLCGFAVSACGGEERHVITPAEAAFVPVIESAELHVGMSRIVLTLIDRDRQPEFSGDVTYRIRYFDPTEAGIKFHSEAELQAIDVEGLRYLIAADVPFDEPGQWAIAVTVELSDGAAVSSPRLPVLVSQAAQGPTPGEMAPDVATPTIADGILERMSPVEDSLLPMYERSAPELLAVGEPFLIVWSSAERCAGRLACARALEQATSILQSGAIAVLHVEPFGRPRSGELQAMIDTAVEAWGIEAEPLFFVVDGTGTIASRFEIVVEDAELREAVGAVAR